MLYHWLKIFHIVFMVAWYAGMFYIWRLFVYHSETESEDVKKTLMVMENKLYKIIMNPAMMITITLGIILFAMQWSTYSVMYWIWIKILLVAILLGLHILAKVYMKKLGSGEKFDSKKFRIINEIPTLLLIGIVALAVFRSF